MIVVKNKEECCGCEACVQICPKECIIFEQDIEGFSYPLINVADCIDCGLCEKVCPILNVSLPQKYISVYAAKNLNDQIRKESSSGGVFTLLSEKVLEEGGVVFGAKFNKNWEVVHDYTETKEGLAQFRSSKYVQSRIGNNYAIASAFLKEGRKVLFTGTPCQVAGLRKFLRIEYDNLLLVDFICHGVPSPGIWRRYLAELVQGIGEGFEIKSISFRDKTNGWKDFGFFLSYVSKYEGSKSFYQSKLKNAYLKGFLENLYLRPSCHACCVKSFKSGSDITIGDFWGIQRYLPHFNDNVGVSLVIANSADGETFFHQISIDSIVVKDIILQPMLYKSVKSHQNRNQFFEACNIRTQIIPIIDKLTKFSLSKRLSIIIRTKILKILGRSIINNIKYYILWKKRK